METLSVSIGLVARLIQLRLLGSLGGYNPSTPVSETVSLLNILRCCVTSQSLRSQFYGAWVHLTHRRQPVDPQ